MSRRTTVLLRWEANHSWEMINMWCILFILTSHHPYLKLKLLSCKNYWIQQKSSNTITGRSHSIGAINVTTQDFNRLMQLRPFYFDTQINVSPWFAAQKTLASHVASFPHICKLLCRLFLSAIVYDLSAILQAERLAFRLYDAWKIRSTGSFSFLASLQYSKHCRFAIVQKYEL